MKQEELPLVQRVVTTKETYRDPNMANTGKHIYVMDLPTVVRQDFIKYRNALGLDNAGMLEVLLAEYEYDENAVKKKQIADLERKLKKLKEEIKGK